MFVEIFLLYIYVTSFSFSAIQELFLAHCGEDSMLFLYFGFGLPSFLLLVRTDLMVPVFPSL